jgi:hypothetical protein
MREGAILTDTTADRVQRSRNGERRIFTPVMNCPFCGAHSHCRSSEEITSTLRRLYYRCPDLMCSATWAASLQVENIISPSGMGREFRRHTPRNDKPPGRDFGQMSLFQVIAPDPG